MNWMLVLYFAGGLNGGMAAVAIGPYPDQPNCHIAARVAQKDGWSKTYCYPIGKIELPKKEEPPKTEEKPEEKKP